MESADGDVLARVLRFVGRERDIATCRLVCESWREAADSVMTRARSDFLARRPGCGARSRRFELRTPSCPGIKVGFASGSGASGGCSEAALRLAGFREAPPALLRKDPVYLACERRLLRGECLALRGLAGTLLRLDLRGVAFRSFPKRSRAALCDAVALMARLEVLEIPAHDLSPADVRSISRNGSITRLNIHRNAAGEACDALAAMHSLRKLDIGNNGVSRAGAHLSRLASLTDLNVDFNGMADEDVGGMLSGLPALRKLSTSWNECGPRAKRAIRAMSALVSLHASFTAAVLCDAVPGLGALVRLELNSSGIADADSEHLARSKSLACLKLSNNSITDGGVAALCAGLCGTLTDLDLSCNGVGHAGALRIAGGLPGLLRLDIRENAVLDVGAEALSGLPVATYINVSYNGLSASFSRELKHRARKVPGLTLVAFSR